MSQTTKRVRRWRACNIHSGDACTSYHCTERPQFRGLGENGLLIDSSYDNRILTCSNQQVWVACRSAQPVMRPAARPEPSLPAASSPLRCGSSDLTCAAHTRARDQSHLSAPAVLFSGSQTTRVRVKLFALEILSRGSPPIDSTASVLTLLRTSSVGAATGRRRKTGGIGGAASHMEKTLKIETSHSAAVMHRATAATSGTSRRPIIPGVGPIQDGASRSLAHLASLNFKRGHRIQLILSHPNDREEVSS